MIDAILFDLARFIPLILFLIYPALLDIEKGEVPNRVWRYILYGGAITTLELIYFNSLALLIVDLTIIAVFSFLGYLLFALNGWGGADAKAFMVISVSAPMLPTWGIINGSGFPFTMLPFIVLFTSCLGACIYALAKKTNVPFSKRKVKFLPFMLIGLIIAVVL